MPGHVLIRTRGKNVSTTTESITFLRTVSSLSSFGPRGMKAKLMCKIVLASQIGGKCSALQAVVQMF